MANRRLLPEHWQLRDVRDTEGLIWRAVDDQLRSMRAHLPEHEREDLASYLFAVAWELHLRYDPAKGVSFSRYLYRTARLRVVDWYRQRYHDTRSPKPELPLSLDRALTAQEPDALDSFGAYGEGTRSQLDRLERALGERSLDAEVSRSPDLTRLLLRRSGPTARDDQSPSQRRPRRAA